MATRVEIDDDVWAELQALAEPLIDTPNSVLRRVLGLDGAASCRAAIRMPSRERAPVGSLLPESRYELPILRVLAKAGGSAPARDVVHAVGELLPNGSERWQSRIQFSRLRMKERGLIKSGSPRGLWELADAGADLLRSAPGAS